eukprot:gnl/MRDRNA2_/MRDRNA2_758713_c0_seq1.p1 gnl/MRDRNA2_/MRDRNA2_758713_c0~~gnl/MRDRNA2_/MRDRNA2_758713_c0_seq1.p1  ORF type:complete len:104 (+),score=11.58 gnl/MRDRNA2_/MRDRNA2_758713_c0_seq1:14-325(+)
MRNEAKLLGSSNAFKVIVMHHKVPTNHCYAPYDIPATQEDIGVRDLHEGDSSLANVDEEHGCRYCRIERIQANKHHCSQVSAMEADRCLQPHWALQSGVIEVV